MRQQRTTDHGQQTTGYGRLKRKHIGASFLLLTTNILLLTFSSFSQLIKSNTVDGFTNERTIETSMVSLKQGFSTGFGASYTAVDRNYYINIMGYGTIKKTINEDDKLWFVLDDGSVVKFELRLPVASNDENYDNLYIHHYFVRLDDVEAMKDHKLLMVRVVNTEGVVTDIPVSKKASKQFAKLNEIFLNEVSK